MVYKNEFVGLIVVFKHRETNESKRPPIGRVLLFVEIASQTAYIDHHLNRNSMVTFFSSVA